MSINAVAVWDFTISMDKVGSEDLVFWLKKFCKKYSFQGEKGAGPGGYEHWQGRISLKVKARKCPLEFG